ncbi:MAG: PhoH family protein [Deltaproteobacteria bacterium]|nr:PhoH family protein [Deltaproteobacteria bacterium]
MQKNYVLDTNVLLHDPGAIFRFEENQVVIPIYVIEEIDQFKKEMSELGRNARQVARYLDDFREKGGSLSRGVDLPGGGSLSVAVPKERRTGRLDSAAQDNAIVQVALDLRDSDRSKPTVFVTMDTNLRIRADALGLAAENYDSGRVDIDELYSGLTSLDVPAAEVDELYARGEVKLNGQSRSGGRFPNACVLLRDETNPAHTALGRMDPLVSKVMPLRVPREGVWGIRPRNKEQSYALDLLLDDSVKIVSLVGKAGTGKTLLAIAAGLRKVADENIYTKLLVSRPIFPLGRDIGYLPGDIDEKLNPWMQPIFDSIEYIMGIGRSGDRKAETRSFAELLDMGLVEVEPLTYIRGRSLPNQFLVVDEAQNLTPHEVKTIITRVGSGTKIVLTGDPYQIDNPYVDASSNGLTCVAERFKMEKISGHITLTKGERSELAELAANLL